ncbi:MAG: asparaginase [Acidobacteriota bacterium]
MRENAFEPLVRVKRGGTVESIHWAALSVCDTRGNVLLRAGDGRRQVYWRSAAKPFQAWPLVECGAAERFGVSDRELAVISASHGGEPFHLEAVRSILAKIGCGERDLKCGAHPPMHAPQAERLIREGRPPTVLHNNCSGKHAGMLALSRHLGVVPEDYLEPAGPVQSAIRSAIARHAGLPADAPLATAVDGCSAPTFALPLESLARAYAALGQALAGAGTERSLSRVARAMAKYPAMVAGSGRLGTALMQVHPGTMIAKIGAEGVFAVATSGPREPLGVAVKVADGNGGRALRALVPAILGRLALLDRAELSLLQDRFPPSVKNHRQIVVGEVEVELPDDLDEGENNRNNGGFSLV